MTAEPEARLVRYHVSLLPADHPDGYLWTIQVSYRGHGLWGVYKGAYEWSSLPEALGADGTWDHEGSAERESKEWLASHRFPLEQALDLAKQQASLISFRGVTAADVLARDDAGACLHPPRPAGRITTPPGAAREDRKGKEWETIRRHHHSAAMTW